MKDALEHFVETQPRWVVALGASLLHAVLYFVPNHFQVFPPRELPLTEIDRAIPLLPTTAWIYWSDYFLVFVAFNACKRPRSAWRFAVTVFITIVFGTAIHWAWPVVYPRSAFPMPDGIDPVTRTLLGWFRAVDSPASCMPSLHVATSFVAVFALRDATPGRRALLFVWATAIAVATLTTKQHYVADVLAGIALAAGASALTLRWMHPRTRVSSPRSSVRTGVGVWGAFRGERR